MLIGNNLALVIFGIVMAQFLDPGIRLLTQSDGMVLVLQTFIATLVILVLGEFFPKTLFRINPNQTLRIFAVPVYIFYLLFYPIAKIITSLSRFIIRIIFRADLSKDAGVSFNRVDLDHFVNENHSDEDDKHEKGHDVKIFQNALDFSKVKLRECIVPRTEVVAVAIDDSVDYLKQRFIETGYSKIMVYEKSMDNIIGFAPSMHLFKKPNTIKEMVQNLPIVPESMAANKLLALFIQNRKSMALVVDEFGGTSGIVTMEDILEEIVGDIQDEHDKVNLISDKINDNEFKFSGRLEIDDLNGKYSLNLPVSDDYETIAGLILAHSGSIPKVNDVVLIEGFSFRILKATTTKIELVHLKISR
jgi:CBS domain containing-hemolysin-like protein